MCSVYADMPGWQHEINVCRVTGESQEAAGHESSKAASTYGAKRVAGGERKVTHTHNAPQALPRNSEARTSGMDAAQVPHAAITTPVLSSHFQTGQSGLAQVRADSTLWCQEGISAASSCLTS